ncbi:flavodoxin family protein [Methanobacterium oryzae]|uniref:flavodoxin family protein n=1 Tax=Methanobacterium oryzae TaxID=69540 RepID=UPI003D1D6017
MDLLIIVGLIIVLLIVISLISYGFIALDLMSYTATSSKTLIPSGTQKGNALVVYNPGLSGAAKKAANDIAEEIKSREYKVDLAGVRSKTASNTADYDIIIAGGPMYWGKVSSSIDKYLKTIKPAKNAKIGVFGTTGSAELHEGDMASLEKQVTSNLNKEAIAKTLRSGEANKIDCKDFVSAVI